MAPAVSEGRQAEGHGGHVKVVYVAGPFRSVSAYMPGQQDAFGIQQNIMRAMELALEVWRAGAVALCPHGNTFCFQNAAPDGVWLAGDLELLRRCDAVIMTPDWRRSSGAREEERYARAHGVPVFYELDALRAWLGAKEAA